MLGGLAVVEYQTRIFLARATCSFHNRDDEQCIFFSSHSERLGSCSLRNWVAAASAGAVALQRICLRGGRNVSISSQTCGISLGRGWK